MPRTIFHIDMNAYFASVTAQANPFLRGKAFGVGGKPGTRGIVAAASYKAKQRGVKTAMNSYEALKICPELEFIHGDPRMYTEITNRFLRIFRRYTDEVEVFSIDEAFLDVTHWIEYWKKLGIADEIGIAQAIKADMRRELGSTITCSVGISENKLLAKLGSNLLKPDGIVVIQKSSTFRKITRDEKIKIFSFKKLWPQIQLTDLCGVANRIRARLSCINITTPTELGTAPLNSLIQEFGPVMGYHLHLMGRGEDPSPVVSVVEPAKSYGHSYTLPKDISERSELRKVLFTLSEKVCRRMRRDGVSGRLIWCFVRYHDFSGNKGRTTLKNPIDDGLKLFREGWKIVRPLISTKQVRLLGIGIGLIDPTNQQLSLFKKDNCRKKLISTADKANDQWGERMIEPASTLGVLLRRHVSGFHHSLPVHVRRKLRIR